MIILNKLSIFLAEYIYRLSNSREILNPDTVVDTDTEERFDFCNILILSLLCNLDNLRGLRSSFTRPIDKANNPYPIIAELGFRSNLGSSIFDSL